ncbi:MAG: 50S ribosomal protein L3 [Chloroflexi bacterium B3_Chlor]|nr:MAG: 50S ribosomal protein L3 [Chloroflexi bacterium B3_Chlor]
MKGILGKKVGMTQIFDDTGEVTPVTVIEAGPCYVTQIKTKTKDGYEAVQLGFAEAKRLNRPQRGHLPKGVPDVRYLGELKVDDISVYEIGQKIDAGIFSVGDLVDVTGISKGKGFAGAMKRHGFAGGPATHGQSDRARAPGSIGATSSPGRVFKGKRMPGHMGSQRTTVQNLKVAIVDPERNLLAVKGAVPGAKGGLVTVKSAVKGM